MAREKLKRGLPRGESTEAEHWGGPIRTSDEGSVMGPEQRGRVRRLHHRGNWRQEDPVRAADKPFSIDKKLVYEAYKAVRANAGAAGVDGQTIAQFEADLRGNLYKLWNRMSSGLPSTSGPRRRHSEEEWRATASGRANRGGSCGPDGGQADD